MICYLKVNKYHSFPVESSQSQFPSTTIISNLSFYYFPLIKAHPLFSGACSFSCRPVTSLAPKAFTSTSLLHVLACNIRANTSSTLSTRVKTLLLQKLSSDYAYHILQPSANSSDFLWYRFFVLLKGWISQC